MTREEAIQYLVATRKFYSMLEKQANTNDEAKFGEALDIAIESLSADTVKGYNLETIADIVRQLGHLDDYVADICDRPKGEWIFNAYENTDKSWFICSECGNSVFHKSNYCSHCGADMRGADR